MADKHSGRPTKLTPSVVDAICDAVEVGVNYADAAAAGGVSSATLSVWRQAGEDVYRRVQDAESAIELTASEKRFLNFWKRFSAAESTGAINAATVVYNAAMKDPDFALKWLERRRSADWALRQRNEVTGADGGPVVFHVVYEE